MGSSVLRNYYTCNVQNSGAFTRRALTDLRGRECVAWSELDTCVAGQSFFSRWRAVILHKFINLRSWLHQRHSRKACSLKKHIALVPDLSRLYLEATVWRRHAQEA